MAPIVGKACLVVLAWVRHVGETRLVMITRVSGTFSHLRLCSEHEVEVVNSQVSDGTMARSGCFMTLVSKMIA